MNRIRRSLEIVIITLTFSTTVSANSAMLAEFDQSTIPIDLDKQWVKDNWNPEWNGNDEKGIDPNIPIETNEKLYRLEKKLMVIPLCSYGVLYTKIDGTIGCNNEKEEHNE